jgi:glutaminase
MDYQKVLDEIYDEIKSMETKGEVADYIPELSLVSKDHFAIALQTVGNRMYTVGDSKVQFSTQSISKLFTLTMAINIEGKSIWTRVGKEPSGTSFNSLIQLESENGVPRNPFINSGALVVSDIILSEFEEGKESVLDSIQCLANSDEVHFDEKVAKSEAETGYRNIALANFIKHFKNLDNEPKDVLDLYFHQCSIAMSCEELATAALFLANQGYNPVTAKRVTSESRTKRLNSLLLTCGTYDASGDFAFKVGLPSKSGIGGGIVAVMPNLFVITVWSPGLDTHGNSLLGLKALELFTEKTDISIF